jgi:hypothetical protein
MKVIMLQNKVTANAVRYGEPKKENDPHAKNIYMTKAELTAEFGYIPGSIDVNITETPKA